MNISQGLGAHHRKLNLTKEQSCPSVIVYLRSIGSIVSWIHYLSLIALGFLPFLALTLCLPIDGVASNIIILYYMETPDNANCVWLHFFDLPPYTEREKNHLNVVRCFCRQRESNSGCLRSERVAYLLLQCLSATSHMLSFLFYQGNAISAFFQEKDAQSTFFAF